MVKRKDVIKFLENNGFSHCGGTKHDKFKHPDGRWTTVERHREISNSTFRDIKKQIGLK